LEPPRARRITTIRNPLKMFSKANDYSIKQSMSIVYFKRRSK
jgi:hypothetical protein